MFRELNFIVSFIFYSYLYFIYDVHIVKSLLFIYCLLPYLDKSLLFYCLLFTFYI